MMIIFFTFSIIFYVSPSLQKTVFQSLPFHIRTQFSEQIVKNGKQRVHSLEMVKKWGSSPTWIHMYLSKLLLKFGLTLSDNRLVTCKSMAMEVDFLRFSK